MIGENSIALPFSTGKALASNGFDASVEDIIQVIKFSIDNIKSKTEVIALFIEKFNPVGFNPVEIPDGIDIDEFERICRDNEEDLKKRNTLRHLQQDKLLALQLRIKNAEESILKYFLYTQNFEAGIDSFREEAKEVPAEIKNKVLPSTSEISSESLSSDFNFSSTSSVTPEEEIKSENSTSIKNTLSIQEKALKLAEKIEDMKKPLREDLAKYDAGNRELSRLNPTKNGNYKKSCQKALKKQKSELEDSLGISPVWKSAAKGFAKGFIAGAAISAALACTAGVYVAGVASAASIFFPPAIFLIPAFYTFVAVAAVAGDIVTGVIAAGVEAYQRSKYNHAIRAFIVEKSTDKFHLQSEPGIK